MRIKALRVQRKMFWEDARELKKEEFERLLRTARKTNQERLALLMENITGTASRFRENRCGRR